MLARLLNAEIRIYLTDVARTGPGTNVPTKRGAELKKAIDNMKPRADWKVISVKVRERRVVRLLVDESAIVDLVVKLSQNILQGVLLLPSCSGQPFIEDFYDNTQVCVICVRNETYRKRKILTRVGVGGRH